MMFFRFLAQIMPFARLPRRCLLTLEPPFPSSDAMKVGSSMATLEPAPELEEDWTVALDRTNKMRTKHKRAGLSASWFRVFKTPHGRGDTGVCVAASKQPAADG